MSKVFKKLKLFQKAEVESKIPIPNEIYNFRTYLFAFLASFGSQIAGYDTGFIGGTCSLDSFRDEFGINDMSSSYATYVVSNVISVFHVGAFFGAFMAYPTGEKLGRKIALFISGFLLTFGGAISLASNESTGLHAIYAGRVITGLGVGFCSGITPMYVSEISPPAIRGILTGIWEFQWQIGGLIGYWINLGVSQHIKDPKRQWMVPFAVQIIPSAIFWIGIFFLPESPRWLISKYKRSKAEEKLAYITNLSIDHEFVQYELSIMEEKRDFKKLKYGEGIFQQIKSVVTSPKYLKRLFLSTSTFILQNSAGINAVTYYSVTVFKSIGLSGSDAKLLSTGLFGVIKLLASIFWLAIIVDNWGRRAAFFYGCIPCAITMYYLGAFIKITDPASKLSSGQTQLDSAGKAALAMFYIWTFAYGATFNGTCWVYCSELFDQDVRSLVSGINAASNWLWAFIFARFTGNMFEAMDYGVYFLFAGCMTVAPIIIYCFFPETKGVPLEVTDQLFEVPAWRGRSYALSQLSLLNREALEKEKAISKDEEDSADVSN
ncbi:putative membrane protein [Wickerhamomyces ciferrii]|uniref:Quinate transporter n=1 Tax=Wickerhamomyces ciferrii (strain ATCC 14091 / BCRC 22168 / CBS 111 / JCM 3599 / NBRC 0793 / NRRL Y-1031 F-60-10) TaxID=1206466 RepID=K0KMW9_WICCF|nr:uncharacterized protein BN7_3114 [Wickerhamomyces ciferrii]CCH43562.1 putative membrane protein [Wickerhamomyces ciferrii]